MLHVECTYLARDRANSCANFFQPRLHGSALFGSLILPFSTVYLQDADLSHSRQASSCSFCDASQSFRPPAAHQVINTCSGTLLVLGPGWGVNVLAVPVVASLPNQRSRC
jgi:hypothetical protein